MIFSGEQRWDILGTFLHPAHVFPSDSSCFISVQYSIFMNNEPLTARNFKDKSPHNKNINSLAVHSQLRKP